MPTSSLPSRLLSLLLFVLVVHAKGAPPAPAISSKSDVVDGIHVSTDGLIDLQWSLPEGFDDPVSFELQEKNDASDFAARYSGPDPSSVRTGLADGGHVFRVRAVDESGPGPWSEPIQVEVRYMDAGKVRLLLILGGIVVSATIGAIAHGHLTHGKEGRP